MPKPKLVEVVCVIDKSGSMTKLKDEAIENFNLFLKEQKDLKAGKCRFTITLFDTRFETIESGTPVGSVKEFDETIYKPGGFTALLDAVGSTIDEVRERLDSLPKKEQPDQIIFMIMTDGHENSSQEYSYGAIKERITQLEKDHSWTFVYLGAHANAFAQSDKIGVRKGQTQQFGQNKQGIADSYRTASEYTTNKRTGS